MRVCVVLSLLLALAIAWPARAQDAIAVTGRITDASGAVLPGAAIDVLAGGRRISSTTSANDGSYRLEVPSGVPFDLRIRLDGFAEQSIAIAGQSQLLTRNVTLPVAGVSDSVIVTAARTALSRASVTESVSAFTRQDIVALGSSSLADIVRFVPGVNVESTGREGAVTSMFSRGGESDYNLVLIDGVRANQSGGIFDFSRINAAEIDRVEVVRGAQSALWGSDAMGSVVQIFTRQAGPRDAAQVTAAFEAGSFGVMRSDARVNGGAGRVVSYHAGASRRDSDGAFQDALPEDDTFSQSGFDAGAGVMLGNRGTLRGSVRYTTAEGKSVGQIAYGARDTGTGYTTRDLSSHVDFTHAIGARFVGAASYNDFRYESVSADTIASAPFSTYAILTGTPNAMFPNGTKLVRLIDVIEFTHLVAAGAMPAPGQFLASRTTTDFPFNDNPTLPTAFNRPAFRYQGDYRAGVGQVSGGYEWEREENPATAGFRLNNQAAFVQYHAAIGERWFATAGGRVDSKDSYDTYFSPKLSAGGFVVPYRGGGVSSLKVFVNVGKGIKSPTFSERFGGAFADPAPHLKVERARTADAGIESTFGNQRFLGRVTYFNNEYTDQIAFRSGIAGDGIAEFINIDGSKAGGWELEWALQRAAAGLTASASYAFVDHRVVTNLSTSQQFQPGQPLLRRPRHSGAVRASFVRGRLAINADARIVGDRHDHSFLSLRTVPNAAMPAALTTDITVNPGYAVFGAGADVELHRRLTVFVRGANLGDEAYEHVLGYPAMPRSFVAGARVHFGALR